MVINLKFIDLSHVPIERGRGRRTETFGLSYAIRTKKLKIRTERFAFMEVLLCHNTCLLDHAIY